MITHFHAHCPGILEQRNVNSILNSLGRLSAVSDIEVDLNTKSVAITYDANQTNEIALTRRLQEIGLPAKTAGDDEV